MPLICFVLGRRQQALPLQLAWRKFMRRAHSENFFVLVSFAVCGGGERGVLWIIFNSFCFVQLAIDSVDGKLNKFFRSFLLLSFGALHKWHHEHLVGMKWMFSQVTIPESSGYARTLPSLSFFYSGHLSQTFIEEFYGNRKMFYFPCIVFYIQLISQPIHNKLNSCFKWGSIYALEWNSTRKKQIWNFHSKPCRLEPNANSINSESCYGGRHHQNSSCESICSSSFSILNRNVCAISMTGVASIYDSLSRSISIEQVSW